jgi:hypothetical protein
MVPGLTRDVASSAVARHVQLQFTPIRIVAVAVAESRITIQRAATGGTGSGRMGPSGAHRAAGGPSVEAAIVAIPRGAVVVFMNGP